MDGHHHSDFGGGGFGGCDSFQQTTSHGGFDSHHSSHGGGFDNHGAGGFGGCDAVQQSTHHGGGFDHHHSHHHHHGHHHHGHHHEGLDPVQQDINCGGSVQHLHHHHHGGFEQHHQLHSGQQHYNHQPVIVVVGRTYPAGNQERQFKCQITVGVILLVISIGLIAAGAATIGFALFPGAPLLGFGGLLLLAGITFTVSGCTSRKKWRSQPVTPATVVTQPPSTVYVPPPSVISPGNATNASAPYHQGFSFPPPPYSSK